MPDKVKIILIVNSRVQHFEPTYDLIFQVAMKPEFPDLIQGSFIRDDGFFKMPVILGLLRFDE